MMIDVSLLLNIFLVLFVIAATIAVVYLIFVLRDLREAILKANKVLDNAGTVSGMLSNPVETVMQIVNGVVSGIKSIKNLKTSQNVVEEDD